MVDEHQSHSTDLSVSGEEGHSTILLAHYILWFYNWGQSCLVTLVKPQNCPKMLRNLIFVVQFAYFSIRPKNVWFFRATFEQVSLQKATFIVSWAIFEQLFVKSRVTFWKISSNLCKAPFHLLMQKIIQKIISQTQITLPVSGPLSTIAPSFASQWFYFRAKLQIHVLFLVSFQLLFSYPPSASTGYKPSLRIFQWIAMLVSWFFVLEFFPRL